MIQKLNIMYGGLCIAEYYNRRLATRLLTKDINPTTILPRRKGNQVQNVYINGILLLCDEHNQRIKYPISVN